MCARGRCARGVGGGGRRLNNGRSSTSWRLGTRGQRRRRASNEPRRHRGPRRHRHPSAAPGIASYSPRAWYPGTAPRRPAIRPGYGELRHARLPALSTNRAGTCHGTDPARGTEPASRSPTTCLPSPTGITGRNRGPGPFSPSTAGTECLERPGHRIALLRRQGAGQGTGPGSQAADSSGQGKLTVAMSDSTPGRTQVDER